MDFGDVDENLGSGVVKGNSFEDGGAVVGNEDLTRGTVEREVKVSLPLKRNACFFEGESVFEFVKEEIELEGGLRRLKNLVHALGA